MTVKSLLLLLLVSLIFFAGLILSSQTPSAQAQAASNTVTPTRTPRPTPTPTTTPVPALQLPDWMRDPAVEVIALFTYDTLGDAAGGPTFINVNTGERFILELSYVDEIGWVDAPDGVYIRLSRYRSSGADNSDGFTEYVNLDTGELVRVAAGEGGALANRPTPLLPVGNGGDLAYRLTAQAEWIADTIVDTTYQMVATGELIVSSIKTGETLYRIGLSSSVHHVTPQWFGQGQYLGVWMHRDERAGLNDSVIIRAVNGDDPLYFDDMGQVRWSDQHTLMLYRELYFEDHPICLMNVENYVRETDCEFLSVWEDENHSVIQDYQWSDDGQTILFTYRNEDQPSGGLCVVDAASLDIDCSLQVNVTTGIFSGYYRHQAGNAYGYYRYINLPPEGDFWDTDIPRESGVCLISQDDYTVDCFTDRVLPADTYSNQLLSSPFGDGLAVMYTGREWNDGVCFANLQTGDVTCPDDDAIYGYIDTYGWSPNGRFFLVMYGGTSPQSDDKTNMMFGVFDTLNGTYRDEGHATYENSLTGLWRPPLNR